jgi:hypothetical protein
LPSVPNTERWEEVQRMARPEESFIVVDI